MKKRLKKDNKMNASILPSVLIICILILLIVFSVYMMWSSQSLFVAGINYRIAQNANIESACVLYKNDSTFIEKFIQNNEYQLYDDDKLSFVKLKSSLWGLYELVTIKGYNGKQESCRLLGNIHHSRYNCNLYYPDNNNSLIITGSTSIGGIMYLPKFGIRSGQLQSEFFSGTKVEADKIRKSEKTLPPPLKQSEESLKSLFESIGNIMYPNGEMQSIGDYADNVETLPSDALVVAKKIVIKENSIIQGQLFATDTIIIETGAILKYPSGIYLSADNPKRYIEIQSRCIVNGYIILSGDGNTDFNYLNYKQFPQSEINGMVYINGTAQLHGHIHGPLFLQRAIYYSNYGYYDNTIYNALIEENAKLLFPQWLNAPYGKKEIKWLKRDWAK